MSEKILQQFGPGGGAERRHRLLVGSCDTIKKFCQERGSTVLRRLLQELLDGRNIDICQLQQLLATCCDPVPCRCRPDAAARAAAPAVIPAAAGRKVPGQDGWCRVKPVAWLPVSSDYNRTQSRLHRSIRAPGLRSPWWKVTVIIIAILLAIASLVSTMSRPARMPASSSARSPATATP